MPGESNFVDYEALDRAIQAEAESPMVSKWLVIAEVIDPDGSGSRRMLWMSSAETSTADELGLIAYFSKARDETVRQECYPD